MTRPPTGSDPHHHPPLPELPGIEFLRPIGSGGFGEVWLVRNQATGRARAVKLIPRQSSDRASAAGREIVSLTLLEARVLQEHPHLLGIHHVGETKRWLFYLMDAADDLSGAPASCDDRYRPATLHSRLAAGTLEPEECRRYAEQLLQGLDCLHRAGMVHRDVKPANCLFVNRELKLADFGLLTEDRRQISMVGTLPYMPPDGRMDCRADVYAAGLILYEMISGLPVVSFPELGPRAPMIATHPVLRTLNRLMLIACAPQPDQRFRDAGEMLTNLEALETAPSRRRIAARRGLIACAAVLVAAALVGGAWRWWPRKVEYTDVNFITEPFEATILLDGQLLRQSDGSPCTTPCSVAQLVAGRHRVVFRREQAEDLDAGEIDLGRTRQVTARWSSPSR